MRNQKEMKEKKNHPFRKPGSDVIIRRPITAFSISLGCHLSEPSTIHNADMFPAIYAESLGQPCDGCSMKPCELLNKFKEEDKEAGKVFSKTREESFTLLTNAQLAAKIGITQRQVSKLRIAGTNLVLGHESKPN